MSEYTRRIVFLNDYRDGIKLYEKDADVELPFLEASMFVNSGAAKDFFSGYTRTPEMHVVVMPDNCSLDNIVYE